MKIYTFFVSGTHCNACKILIEESIGEQSGVTSVLVNLAEQTVTVEGHIEDTPEALADEWSKLLEPHKYSLSVERKKSMKELVSLAYAIPLGFVLLGLFFILQRSGLVNMGFEGGLTPWTALLIGVI